MFFGNPLHEKIETAHAALRTDSSTPARSVFDQFFVADQSDDFIIWSIFQQAARRPILIQPFFREMTIQNFAELYLVEIVIP